MQFTKGPITQRAGLAYLYGSGAYGAGQLGYGSLTNNLQMAGAGAGQLGSLAATIGLFRFWFCPPAQFNAGVILMVTTPPELEAALAVALN